MALSPGTRLGPYEIVAAIGAGGMGEVYRARDTKLDRDVALKILPESFTADPDRLMRFEREAKSLASLNHSNIAQIYGVEDSTGTPALAMELVEGEDLSQRLERGAIPISEALPVALQISEALEAAHEAGIIHRDLKPANIKVKADGTVKVLDFGLAKAADGATSTSGPSVSNSPTMTSPALTAMGIILGTAAYMSPEQAKGRPVDRRADIWAFGVVLYEMLAGRRAFEGEDVSDLLVAVLSRNADLAALPATTPPRVRRLITRCLDRNPKTRLQHIGEARIALAQADEPETQVTVPAPPQPIRSSRLLWAVAAGGIVVGVALGVGVASRFGRPSEPTNISPARTLVLVTEGRGLDDSQAISPDGRFIAYTASGALWIRNLGDLDARKVLNSDGAVRPFWSPRSDAVAFAARGKLFKVAIDGSQPVELCQLSGGNFTGGSWSAIKGIVFTLSRANWNGDVLRVPEGGGEPERFAAADAARGERRLYDPHFLPDGRTLFYAVTTVGSNDGELAVDRDGTRTLLHLAGGAIQPTYAPDGHLFFTRTKPDSVELWAVGFSLETLTTVGEPFLVSRDAMDASVSSDGTLVCTRPQPDQQQLVWVDRNGTVLGTIGDAMTSSYRGGISVPAISDDATHVVAETDITAVWDVQRGVATHPVPAGSLHADWLPGTREVVYATDAARPQIIARRFDGTGDPHVVLADGGLGPSVSADGTAMVFYRVNPRTQRDVWGVMLDQLRAKGDPFPMAGTGANEALPRISPDGKWVAYESDELGHWEVFVQPFPRGEGRLQVSVGGGEHPMWNPNGSGELFYVSGNDLMSVDIATSPALRAGTPHRLFSGDSIPTRLITATVIERVYGPSPDGRRFVVVKGIGMGRSEVILSEGAVGRAAGEVGQ
jgi:eukaryotic-like serine/threonine-protein kinase